jgi:ABC-type lipoprotein release transport system permease subunit
MAITKLAISTITHRKTRVVLTVLAIALSVSLVVAVTSGYASLEAAIFRYYAEFMGSTDARITPHVYTAYLDERIVDELRDDPDVRTAVGRLETETTLVDLEGKPIPTLANQTATLIGVRLPDDVETASLRMDYGENKGGWFTGAAGNVAVIDQKAAELLKAKVGDEILLPSPAKALRLKVVGICRKPAVLAQIQQTIYVPLETLQGFLDMPNQVNVVLIDLKPGKTGEAFASRWQSKLAASAVPAKLMTTEDRRQALDQQLQGIQFMSYLGGTISMLAATFIVFSTLSMGVTERQRVIAMLRAIGAMRWQVGAWVIIEGMLLALAGVIVGVPLGFLWITILTRWKSDYFVAGTVFSASGITYATIAAMLTALAASILPAWNASRVDVVEAMTSVARRAPRSTPLWSALLGVPLLAVDPILIFTPAIPRLVTFYGHFFLGLPCLFVGFFLLAPAVVWGVERLLARPIAALMGINYELLAQQLTGAIWRAAGTAAALMVGLAILVVMHTQGNTMLNGWKLPTTFPDMFIFTLRGLTEAEYRGLQKIEGIKAEQTLPMSIAVPGLSEGFFSGAIGQGMQQAKKWGKLALPDATMFIGVEPYQAMRMMQLDFRGGDPQDAAYKMSHSVVTLKSGSEHRGGLDLVTGQPTGKVIWRDHEIQRIARSEVQAIEPLQQGGSTQNTSARVRLKDGGEIVGVVREEGEVYIIDPAAGSRTIAVDQIASRTKTGRYLIVTEEFKRLKGLGVGDRIMLEKPGGKEKVEYTIAGVVWSPGIDVFVSKFDVGRQFSQRSAGSVFGAIEDAREDFGEHRINLIAANLQYATERPVLEKRVAEKLGSLGLVYGDVREIKANIESGLRKLLALMSTVALAAIAVASLGVTNTIMASVRTRRWQLGVLRSVGVTRGQTLRMILAEGVLLGLVGCVLGLTAGLMMSVNANGLSAKIIGYDPPIDVPWHMLAYGVLIILSVAFIASSWPAVSAAREEPLSLLQAGRAGA